MRRGNFSRGKKFLFFIPVAILGATCLGFAIRFLWNSILPEVAHVGRLNFWQALGLLVLCRLLFGSFGKGGGKKFAERKYAMREKWRNMSVEERDRFRSEYKTRCRDWHRKREE
ncbi:hypothetical protein ACJVDH_20790 [Pedobacter sp. AW1-32]|uniref:hypothetical protein n=1 Tax=Pedobacter sp. AW1-32 TaxID=3383026 RepID=UPI003FF100E5